VLNRCVQLNSEYLGIIFVRRASTSMLLPTLPHGHNYPRLLIEPGICGLPYQIWLYQLQIEFSKHLRYKLVQFTQRNLRSNRVSHVRSIVVQEQDKEMGHTFLPIQVRVPAPKYRRDRPINPFSSVSLSPANHLSGRNASGSGPKTVASL
jgi:hypothetical protein